MPSRSSFSDKERRARSRLHQLFNNAEGFIHGSLIEMARRCGNPNCRCATGEKHKHRSAYLGQTRKGKTTTTYVGKDFEDQVRRWIDNYRQAIALLDELDQEARVRLEQAKAAKKLAKKKKQTTKHKQPKKKSPPS